MTSSLTSFNVLSVRHCNCFPKLFVVCHNLGSRTIASEENCPRIIIPRTIAPEDNYHAENCFLTIKISPKIIAPTQANSSQRVIRVSWGKLCIAYEYYNIRVLQLRSKTWFTSIYFLQVLTKSCRTPFIREHPH